MRTVVAPWVRFAPVGTFRPGGGIAQVAQLDAVLAGERDELRIGRDELVQAVLDVEPVADAVLQERAPRRGESTALRRDADECGRRLVRRASATECDEREPLVLGRARLGVEDCDDILAAGSASRRGRSCRSAGRPTDPRRG